MEKTGTTDGMHQFELSERDGLARIGRFRTRHGELSTPTLLPVINPSYLTLTPELIERELKLQGFITNGYIIYNHPELREKAQKEGVHAVLGTELPVMTDSGTFQMYVYGEHGDRSKEGEGDGRQSGRLPEPNPSEIIKFQADIKSDIITILDMFTDPKISREEAGSRMEETLKRAKEAVALKGTSALACTVQGGVYPELRCQAARSLSELDCEVHPIGGLVPLMENYRYSEVVEAVIAAKKGLRPDRPVHLFGAGHPMVFPMAVLLGCDLFDSSSYAKYAHADRLIYPEGTRHLEDMEESPCGCPVCSKYAVSDLKDMPDNERKAQLALHNLHVSFNELSAVRQAIYEGTLREMVERRAGAHPYLLSALKILDKNVEFLERYEPLSRRRFFYTGPSTRTRPEVFRYKRRFFERYKQPKARMLILFEDKTGQKPYGAQFAEELKIISELMPAHFMTVSYFGPAPLELDEIYPLAQSVIPTELDPEDRTRINTLMEHFSHKHREVMGIIWDGEETLEFLKSMGGGSFEPGMEQDADDTDMELDFDLLRVQAVADMQFGRGAGEILTNTERETSGAMSKGLVYRKSKRTGRIRNVYQNDEHILSFRAKDGYMSLKPAGAERLRAGMPPPALRVVVNADSAEFNRQGKNVFAKFVLDCDENLRPGDEVLVVSEQDELVAIGRALMTREEMMAFNIGVAVKVRDGIK